jgi:DNA-binding NtrC family response regulator
VEDENSLRVAVAKVLRNSGFSVIEVSDGSSAVEAIRGHDGAIDIILLDLTLPGAPSREIFEEARRLRPGAKVIVTSAYGEDMAAASLQNKAEIFVRKPYRLRDLMELVRQNVTESR